MRLLLIILATGAEEERCFLCWDGDRNSGTLDITGRTNQFLSLSDRFFFFNRTKEYSIMKMAGCNWKQQFCLLFVQSLIVVVISSFLVIWGIELIGNRMDFFSTGHYNDFFRPKFFLIHAMQYIILLILLCAAICLFVLSVFAEFRYKQAFMEE